MFWKGCGRIAAMLGGGAVLAAVVLPLNALAATAAQKADIVKKAGPDAIVEEALPQSDTLVVIATGDGGWWGDLDTKLGRAFAARGDAVVGLDTAIYFDAARTPAEWGDKLAAVVDRYTAATGARRVLLVGWSFGADVLPLGYAALPAATQAKVAGIALLAPRQHTDLEVTLSGRIGLDRGVYALADTLPRLPHDRLVCIKPDDADDTGCDLPGLGDATVLARPGGHGFDGDAEGLVAAILAAIG